MMMMKLNSLRKRQLCPLALWGLSLSFSHYSSGDSQWTRPAHANAQLLHLSASSQEKKHVCKRLTHLDNL